MSPSQAELPSVDDSATSRPTRVRWFVVAIVAFASASAYLTRHCISAANTTIGSELDYSDAEMGQLMSAMALGYLCFQVPGGLLGHRFGTRFAFAFISLVWSFCNFWTAMGSMLRNLSLSRFALGAAQAGLVPISANILKDWIPLRARGVSSSAIVACMSLGGAFTMWLTGWLLGNGFHWRSIFSVYSLVGIAWSIGFFWFFRTYPSEHPGVNAAELDLIHTSNKLKSEVAPNNSTATQPDTTRESSDRKGATLNLLLAMFWSPSMWGICVQSFFRAAGYTFFVTWFFAFLEYSHGVTKAEAGWLNSLPLIAVVIGSLAGGPIVDGLLRKTGSQQISRCWTAAASLGVCGVFTMASAWTSSPGQLATMIAVGAVFSGIANPAAWAATIDIGRRHTSIVVGVMNMAGCLAAVILPLVLGNWFEQIKQSDGDWNLVIYLHAAFYFTGAVCWLLVRADDRLI